MSKLTLKIKAKTTRKPVSKKSTADYSFHTASYKTMLEDHIKRIDGGLYVPDQSYDGLRRGSKKTTLDTVAGIARGVHDAVSAQEPRWHTEPGFNQRLRERELKPLEEWAIKEGLLLSGDKRQAFEAERTMVRGGEHEVFYKEGDSHITKFKQLWRSESYMSTLERIKEHNKIFPESAYTFKGFADGGEKYLQSPNSALRPIVTQPYFRELTMDNAKETLGLKPEHFKSFQDNPNQETYTNLMASITMKHQEMLSRQPDKKKELDAAKWMVTDKNARTEVTLSEIVAYMHAKGFEPMPVTDTFKDLVSGPDATFSYLTYINKSTGMMVSDLRPVNFIRDVAGNIICIDPRIFYGDKTQRDRAQGALNAITV